MNTAYTLYPQKIISGVRAGFIRIRLRLHMARLIFRRYKDPALCLRILREMVQHRRAVTDEKIRKFVRVDGQYHWDLYVPGFNSKALHQFFLGEAHRVFPSDEPSARFVNALVCVTKKCPLKCEHCYEWEALNQDETLKLADVKRIVKKLQDKGVSQIQLTGGEPMLKVDELVEILKSADPGTEFWIFTSGYNLTKEHALKLKNAGLTGVVVSLDHYDPVRHNLFRGSSRAYGWARDGVKNAIEANLVTALSLCATSSFANKADLMTYAKFAKNMGVSFIQLLEPRATGHYLGKAVALSDFQLQVLENFYQEINFSARYRDYPIICYHGHYQRKVGCFGAGNRSLYVDTDGDLHACPFCRTKTGSALADDLDHEIEKLAEAGCHKFNKVNLSSLENSV